MNSIRKQKHELVNMLTSKIKDSNALVVFSYHGLSVPVMQELRKELSENNIELKVYKNRLVKIAAKNAGYEKLSDYLLGPNAFAFNIKGEDITPAKIIGKFANNHESIKLIAGTYENKVIDPDGLSVIANLPSLEEALSMLAMSLMSPLRYIAVGLNMLKDIDSKEVNKTPSAEIKQNESNKEENNVKIN